MATRRLPDKGYIIDTSEYPPNLNGPSQELESTKKVTVGRAVIKKPGSARILSDVFLGDSARAVGEYILFDVVVPAIKETLSNIVTGGIEMLLYGESGSQRGKTPRFSRYEDNRPRIAYNNFSSHSVREERAPRRVVKSNDDIILEFKSDAMAVVKRMDDILREYQQVTVGDLYDLVEHPTTFPDRRYGWKDLSEAGIRRVKDGYLIVLPPAQALDSEQER